jgi:hypothetical protein
MKRTRTLSKRAIREHIPEGVKSANFNKTLDGCQRLFFYYRCLYDAIKELLRNARFAGRQYTHAEIKYNSTGGRAYSAFNTGEVYELAQLHAGKDVCIVSYLFVLNVYCLVYVCIDVVFTCICLYCLVSMVAGLRLFHSAPPILSRKEITIHSIRRQLLVLAHCIAVRFPRSDGPGQPYGVQVCHDRDPVGLLS